jgi:hypothetical protein
VSSQGRRTWSGLPGRPGGPGRSHDRPPIRSSLEAVAAGAQDVAATLAELVTGGSWARVRILPPGPAVGPRGGRVAGPHDGGAPCPAGTDDCGEERLWD